MQQEIRLLHIKVVVGYYVVKAFYYILLLLKVTIYRLSKNNLFCATNISVQKFWQTKWAKNQQKSLKYDPKKVKQW